MAGIGFSLRKILSHDSLSGIAAAYTVAGMISGGPWIISVFGIIALSLFVSLIPEYHQHISQFQISITYLVAGSLILSGCAGNSFARYAADQLYSSRPTYILSNLNGVIFVITAISGLLSFLFVLYFFQQQSITYRLFFMSGFVVLSNVWVVITLLTGLKDYKIILRAFIFSYTIIVSLAYFLRALGLEAFMFSFVLGQLVLLMLLMTALYKEYPTNSIIAFHFFKHLKRYRVLILTGIVFNSAIWVDKFIFWYSPSTSYAVIGPLRASWFYDLPIFIAYLCSVPGLAVFLMLIETDFADYYANFHEAIRRGKSLEYIKIMGEKLLEQALNVVYSIAKIQALTIVIIFQFGGRILEVLHISLLYTNLIFIAVIGTSIQVILLAIISILYHMDRIREVLLLSILFFVSNLILTLATIYIGPLYYGFGFTFALVITCTYGMHLLAVEFTDLEYKVIMLR